MYAFKMHSAFMSFFVSYFAENEFCTFWPFLPFLNTFLILCAGPHDHQNDTLHTIYLDDTSLLFHNKKLFVARAGSRKRCKIVKIRPKIAKKVVFLCFSERCHANMCNLQVVVVPEFISKDMYLLYAIFSTQNIQNSFVFTNA